MVYRDRHLNISHTRSTRNVLGAVSSLVILSTPIYQNVNKAANIRTKSDFVIVNT